MIDSYIKVNNLFWLFTIGFFLAMLLPRLMGEGLFADGIIYASVARNMAIGKGSFWEPFFSTGYYMPWNKGVIFHEHPPLMMGLEAVLFYIFGDHFFIEKLYSFIIACNIVIAIHFLWNLFFKEDEYLKRLSWLPVLLWYTIPTVLWGMPNNMLDNTMTLFTLWSSYFILKGNSIKYKLVYYLLGSFFLVAAFLSKGPVGLFPIAIPFLHFLIFKKDAVKGIIISILTGVLFLLNVAALMIFEAPGKFISTYFNQQVLSAVKGEREDGHLHWHHHFDIIVNLFTLQLLPPVILTIITIIFLNRLNYRNFISKEWMIPFLFFFLIGICGSFPIALSIKQSSFYLIPSTPFFAIVFAIISSPLISKKIIKAGLFIKFYQRIRAFLMFGILIVLVYSSTLYATLSREKEIIMDLKNIITRIPKGEKIFVCETDMKNLVYHAYFQRYGQYELTKESNEAQYLMTHVGCNDDAQFNKEKEAFKKITGTGSVLFTFFKKGKNK